jgi:acetyl-CoA acetyltransferase family protein
MNASRALHAGEGDLMIAGGVEHMTRGPWVISKTSSAFGRDAQMYDSSFGWRFINPQMKAMYGTDAMGETAENLAEQFLISREDQDAFECWSQQKAAAASAMVHTEEIIPVAIPQNKSDPILFQIDEFVRAQTTIEGLAALKPAFRKDGTVTAGNSSGLNDGAAALLLASEKGLHANGLKPLARIVASAVTGVEPRIMGIGPVSASQLALKRAGLQLDQMDVLELNEAFAAQVLACTVVPQLQAPLHAQRPDGMVCRTHHPRRGPHHRVPRQAQPARCDRRPKRQMVSARVAHTLGGRSLALSR